MDIRPWGYFEVLARGDGYQVKRLNIAPGQAISLQKHQYRSETWKVVVGLGEVLVGEQTIRVNFHSDAIYVGVMESHRVRNIGSKELVIIEVQQGDIISEDDIIRYEDDYNRMI